MSPAGAVSRPVGNSGSPQARITLGQSPDSNKHESYSTNDRVIRKVLLRFCEDTSFDSLKLTFEGHTSIRKSSGSEWILSWLTGARA
jgi:hypothetical protein